LYRENPVRVKIKIKKIKNDGVPYCGLRFFGSAFGFAQNGVLKVSKICYTIKQRNVLTSSNIGI
ncbi:MAG: hypothetical protein KJ864_06325, partial [Candidatus Omnitrophica bacterium]|nr:hypothetical protein [Candidatus Omnitrophota bacterium]MBU1894790.1 hypothetical protein [Candidatus Omnitrophota bacterium]